MLNCVLCIFCQNKEKCKECFKNKLKKTKNKKHDWAFFSPFCSSLEDLEVKSFLVFEEKGKVALGLVEPWASHQKAGAEVCGVGKAAWKLSLEN